MTTGYGSPSTLSFYLGREGEATNWRGRFSHFKDNFFKAFTTEYNATLRKLATDTLLPANVEKILDEAIAGFDVTDAKASLSAGLSSGGVPCDEPAMEAARIRTFVRGRHTALLQVIR
jgi:hypothetical protein